MAARGLAGLLAMLEEQVAGLDEAVGPVTALAFVMTIGEVSRFPRGKKVASYLSGWG